MSTINRTRRHFTEAAREAAALARQRKREHRERFPEDHQFVMLVVRDPEIATEFRWQIRQFGRMEPVSGSRGRFADPAEAAREGEARLADMKRDLVSA